LFQPGSEGGGVGEENGVHGGFLWFGANLIKV
jgi:hypothetical protein